MQDIVNVVAPVSATVEAPPLSEFCEKLPSGDVSVQFVTPCELQNTEVRETSGTDAGTAQMFTFGGTTGVVVVATVVAFAFFGPLWKTVTVGVAGFGMPTW